MNWYGLTSPLKLMIDRLVCANGGNPDPSLTHGKEVKEAKRQELKGWSYPRHLEGRLLSVVVHGDVEGVENVRWGLSDWMRFMRMESAGMRLSSTAPSAIGSPTRRATTSSTAIPLCERRSALPLGPCAKLWLRSAPDDCTNLVSR